jgi:hypothetical protein
MVSSPRACHVARAGFAMVAVLGSLSCAAAQKGPVLQRIDRSRLCVTNGVVSSSADGRLAIETSSSRATVQSGADDPADQIAEIRFHYLGPSHDSRPLASAQLRRQIGLKLRGEDSCNLIYAMWRIEPEAKVVVSIKRNAGQHAHRQCGAHGYVNFKPQDGSGPLPVRPGESHTLRAELHGQDLTVTADGKVAWQGSLAGPTALPVGPPGFRTDNGRFAFEYFASAAAWPRAVAQHAAPDRGQCVVSEGD